MYLAQRRLATNRSNGPETSAGTRARASSQCKQSVVGGIQASWASRTRIADGPNQIKFFSPRARAPVKSFPMANDPLSRRLNLPTAMAVWAVIVLLAAFTGAWLGYGGRRLALVTGGAGLFFAF